MVGARGWGKEGGGVSVWKGQVQVFKMKSSGDKCLWWVYNIVNAPNTTEVYT